MNDRADSFTKDPDARLDFGCDWSEWLRDGETIVNATWDVPAGLTLDTADYNTTLAVVWLSGGAPGAVYRITNQITTSEGRTDERSLLILVQER